MTSSKNQNVQDVFLNNVRKNKHQVTIFLISGVKLQGIITWFDNFSVLLDSMSYPYLFGSTLDFVEDLSGSKFVINNPNAKTTCGCGESFTI